jgi:DNA-binding LacI/PurR family transcriptional regulator
MADVAKLAGVSHQTVSRVLNGHPNVSATTKASVMAAIRDLGYRPNVAARTLVTGKTNVLGVISFDTTLYGPASMLYGIERAARPGYFIAIASLPSFNRASLTKAVERFLGQAVAGTCLTWGTRPCTTSAARATGMTPGTASQAGGRRCARRGRRCQSCRVVTGRRGPGTRQGASSPRGPR